MKLFLARVFGKWANVDVTEISARIRQTRGKRAVLMYHLRDWALADKALVKQDFEAFVIEKAERTLLRIPFSVFDGVPRQGRWRAACARCDLKPPSKATRTSHNLGELMLTTALRPSSDCELCAPSSVTQSPPLLLVASTSTHPSPRACGTFVLNDVLSSTRLKPFCSSPIVFTPMDIAPDSPGGCTGHDPVLAPGSPAARKRNQRRLREEGAVGVAIMISDTRGLWRAKSATGVLGLVLTRWRLASTDAGRNEALGLHELERRRLPAGTLSGFVEYLCLATAAGVECRVVLAPRVTSRSNDLNANNSKKWEAAAIKDLRKRSVKIKTHKLESYHFQSAPLVHGHPARELVAESVNGRTYPQRVAWHQAG